ncbi:MAG: thioredoxin domain-containing protein [Tunicatimonas sp.]
MQSRGCLSVIALLFTLTACGQSGTSEKPTNALINETSPYLLQHAHNPVNWQPWGETALEQAQRENKLMIVSIGYAACHWCHVMEHESFEDSAVAALMNEHFVTIKVDREERPDVDQVYMEAAQLMTGRGGWPLNAITLPDGRPVFAGTYFPKDQWMSVLRQVQQSYERTPERLEKIATEVTEGIRSTEAFVPPPDGPVYEAALLDELYRTWKPKLDLKRGGNRGAPKFPMPVNGQFMMQYAYYTGNAEAYAWVETTLEQMARGGIYDHLGGGFARYATDDVWRVPHFEKMLYDNAQLVSLYSQAYRVDQNPLYRRVVYETLDFIAREMTSDEGAFYSSLDADSEGEEGKFYVWTADEVNRILGDEAALFSDYYHITQQGNWEAGKNILYVDESDSALAARQGLSVVDLQRRLQNNRKNLLKARRQRVRPGLDDKSLTAWNALMLNGYVDAYRTFGEPRFLEAALTNARFLRGKVIGGQGAMTRNYKAGTATIDAFLDDYAQTIAAFINLYQATFDASWLETAQMLQQYALNQFYDEASGLFFYTSNNHPELIARKKEVSDNVIPASNSVMANNLYQLGLLLYEDAYVEKAQTMLTQVTENLRAYPGYYANWASLLSQMTYPRYEVAIVGDAYAEQRTALDRHYLPNALLLGGSNEGDLALLEDKLVPGQTTIYVCEQGLCKLPVTEAARAVQQIVPNR